MGFLALFLLALIGWFVYEYSDDIANWLSKIGVREDIKTIEPIKKEKMKVSSSNYLVDKDYDKLISIMLDELTVLGVDEHYLKFLYRGDLYKIWIANKDCAYGTRLYDKNMEVVGNKGLSNTTLNKLYKKEIEYEAEHGEIMTNKERERIFIKSMLESIEGG